MGVAPAVYCTAPVTVVHANGNVSDKATTSNLVSGYFDLALWTGPMIALLYSKQALCSCDIPGCFRN